MYAKNSFSHPAQLLGVPLYLIAVDTIILSHKLRSHDHEESVEHLNKEAMGVSSCTTSWWNKTTTTTKKALYLLTYNGL